MAEKLTVPRVIGADVELVGPGKAYARWKTTAKSRLDSARRYSGTF
jgi:hypothetical protein